MKAQAAVMYSVNAPLKVEALDLSPPGRGEVLIRMGAAGVCHSDYHVISGQAGHDLPVVLGHEGAGEIVALGEGVTDFALGDHVVLSWIPYCDACFFCDHNQTHLCQTYKGPLWDGTMMDGTCRFFSNAGGPVRHLSMLACWADHVVVPQESCVRMDKAVPFEIAALLGCAVTTGVGAVLNRAEVTPGSTVAVIGAGGVGLSIIMGAKLAGASQIIAVDSAPETEAKAREMGATEFIAAAESVADRLGILVPYGVDHVFEAVGKRALQRAAIDYCRPGGKVIFVGMDANDATIDLPTTGITRSEIMVTGSIFGSACTTRDFVAYAQHYLDGKLPIDRLIGRRYGLQQINEAVADMLAGKPGRGVILFDGDTP
ncbi:NDMA-dependent alcohol dehydrogenase [Roseovarius albus]|uniref:NDMA-dependent alcohol dehydrogenase n=1 Tax=Roseovarius albus TaxID=1247867 RepID=A0A1X6Y7J6_9RHOB|nr:Zn-dependent alcohol dehydrogenase [Roseovarius albus]SLN13331.1 NDMA-dependent alcohol dehydrogenase [Roseovarius albus]